MWVASGESEIEKLHEVLIFLILSNFPEKEINMVLSQEWRYEEKMASV